MFKIIALLTCFPLWAHAASLAEILTKFQLPALTTAVRKNNVTHTQVAGVRKIGDPTIASAKDKWHIGSNGKALTATLGAILAERGYLSWDSTVKEIFPDWNVHEGYAHITMKELFANRAGVHADITTFAEGKYWEKFLDHRNDVEALREEFTKAVFTSAPESDGKKFRYSNSGFVVAANMLTKRTGKSWEELMTTLIFQPLGMSSCGFGAAGAEFPDYPTQPWPHESTIVDKVQSISPSDPGSDNPLAIGPAGTIHCSMEDWMKFAQAHLDGFHGIDSPILRASGFEYLHKDYQAQGYTSGGLIYEKRNGKVYLGHNGSNTMNFAILVLDTAGNSAYAAATNIGHRSGEKGTQAAMLSIDAPDVCIQGFCLLTK